MLPAPFTDSLILTGPTGSGKTQLGIELARRLDAEIVSMDSMALYRHLDIGTAKPTLQQRQSVRHHLIDVLDPWESASVAWWLQRAAACCRDISARGKRALFVGGTPLYVKALLFGLFDSPPASTLIRQRLLQEAAKLGAAGLHEQLARLDPRSAARLHPNDTRRIVRALEVLELTGRPISSWQQEWQADPARQAGPVGDRGFEIADFRFKSEIGNLKSAIDEVPPGRQYLLWLDLPRPVLYDRINARVRDMFAGGWVEEARYLANLDKPLSREARQALGYKEVLAYIEGRSSLEETIVRVQTRSRNFAKRQITWFRHLPGCQSATAQLTEALWQPKMEG
jgi:tRNA dimethylallyltransferase